MKAQFSRLRKTIKGAIHSNKKQKIEQQNDREDDDLHSLSSTLFLPDDDDEDRLSHSSCSTISNISQEHLPHCSSYSNLYYKLPNGNWLVQYRTRDKVVIDSFEIKGNLI
ncbi:unnamed protein product [Mucor circinelloides]|uniref:Uncharacterized protein n=1 Tax=Mucor circinelloides f. circinelloides (strain 1006PhL) TaxID=1220926 RepID=S2K2H1_MUCC1|nr:hypothetical protein HMPREF1544_03772 [Mucor circinelloides 1006PhL]